MNKYYLIISNYKNLVVILLAFTIKIYGQSNSSLIIKNSINNKFLVNDLVRTKSNHIYGLGLSNGLGTYNIFHADSLCNIIWSKAFNAPGFIPSRIVEKNNFLYLLSRTTKPSTFTDFFLITKLTLSGTILFSKSISFPDTTYLAGEPQINIDNNNQIFINGCIIQYMYFCSLDSLGNTIFSKKIITDSISGRNQSNSFCFSSDGNIILAGNTGYNDLTIIKIDKSANVLWSKKYSLPTRSYPNSIIETSDGSFLISGGTTTFSVSSNKMALKIDNNGGLIWYKKYSSPDTYFTGAFELSNTNYLFMEEQGNGVLETDKNGNIIQTFSFPWRIAFGGNFSTLFSIDSSKTNLSFLF